MENIITTKEDDSTLGVVKTVPEKILEKVTYDYGFLKNQLISIKNQKDSDNAARDAEIAEVTALLAEADKLGIIEKVEPIIEPPIKEIINEVILK